MNHIGRRKRGTQRTREEAPAYCDPMLGVDGMLLARLVGRPACRKLTTQPPLTYRCIGTTKVTKPRTDYDQHKQELIEKKKAHVEVLLKQGIVKKATELHNDTFQEYEPYYGEREYVVLDEEKPKKRTKGDIQEWEASLIEANNGEHSHCYAEWCAHYQPLFEKSPYSLGYQAPDENGNYPWMEAMTSANEMVFGNSGFRPLQQEALNASLKGEDVFLSLPTGGGKSLCFWLRALLSPGIAIVISPLIALIHDQVQKLASHGVPVLRLDSANKSASIKALKRGDMKYKLIYVTPERMRSNEFLEILRNLYLQDQISMVAIDEAHCISEWGHDFRPSYSKLGVFRKEFPNIPIMAVTATATQQVQKDILDSLHIQDATVLESSFNRPNIYYEVRSKASAVDDIAHLISSEKYSKASGIIYCLTKSDCEELADALRSRNIHASPYHGSMTTAIRSQIQDAWKKGDSIKVLCTTTAFGLGVDKQDIRYVIHHTLPLSLEAYYQQTGRAAIDRRRYYSQSDLSRATKMLAAASSTDSGVVEGSDIAFEAGGPTGSKVDLMDNMVTFCGEQRKCRREILLAYFGEKIHRSTCNHKCDNCQRLLTSKGNFVSTQHEFVPPPHISLLPHSQLFPTPTRQTAVPQPIHMEEEEEEEEERLSPLEKLKRRREQNKEWRRSKLHHPSQASILFDKANGDRQKQFMERNRKLDELKTANEERLEQLRDAMFKPEHTSINGPTKSNMETSKVAPADDARPTQTLGNSLRNPNKVKLNKTGKIDQTTNSEQPSPPWKGNSLMSRTPNKLNKTGKIDQATDSEQPAPPWKGNSLTSRNPNKLNKTGKIDHATDSGQPWPLRKGNSLMSRNPDKLNKTGKLKDEVSEDYEGPYNRPPPKHGNSLRSKKDKVNKTGRVQENDGETEIRTATILRKGKLNKTGRVSESEDTQDEASNLRDHWTSVQPIITKTNGTPIFGSSGTSAAPLAATKKKVSLAALKRAYYDIASEQHKAGSSIVGEFFSEQVMLNIWESEPTSIVELTTIPGVGKQNAVKYADKILPMFRADFKTK